MNDIRLGRLLDLVQAPQIDRSLPVPLRLCHVCAQAIEVDGAGVSLLSAGSHRSLGASDEIAAAIERVQITMREGPCIDVYHTRHPVLEPDLRSPEAMQRWPLFSLSAIEFGAGAVFGFPLIIADEPIGALDLYCRDARELSGSDVDDALILADMTALAIHTSETREPSAADGLAAEPEQGWAHQAVVHHASGMTAVQLGISVEEATLRLRAFAFASGRSVAEVAGDIVTRRLRMEPWSHE